MPMTEPWQPSADRWTPPDDPSPNVRALLAFVDARNAWLESAPSVPSSFTSAEGSIHEGDHASISASAAAQRRRRKVPPSGAQRYLTLFDETLEHRILPKTLQRPVLNRKGYTEYVLGLLPFYKTYTMTVHEVIEAGDDTVVFHASSTGYSRSDLPFTNEYTITMRLRPPSEQEEREAAAGEGDGRALPKITYVKEFVDSIAVQQFFKKERDLMTQRRQAALG